MTTNFYIDFIVFWQLIAGQKIYENDNDYERIKLNNTSLKTPKIVAYLRVTQHYISPPPSLREDSLFYHFIKTTL